jgi:regulator of protease activity HflC (stomatin/prohibitin superfamily)
MEFVLYIVLAVVAVMLASWWLAARVVRQIERGIVFRLGRAQEQVRQPGLTMLIPLVDRMTKVNIQVVTLPVPAQEGITRDNVTVKVDAVVYFRVVDPWRAAVIVEDYRFAVLQVAQTSLRSIIGKSELDDLLSNREKLNEGLEIMMDSPAAGWGVEIDRVEIKDVALPETMKRSMSRQAEAERERRSRVITADGELQASEKLASAARRMSSTPAALQLRLLQTMVEVAAEKNSTLVLPFPVEMLRFFDSVGRGEASVTGALTGGQAVPETSAENGLEAGTGDPELPAGSPEPQARPLLRSNGHAAETPPVKSRRSDRS